MTVAIAATELNTYPPRVLVSVTGLTLSDRVEVYRVVSTDRTLVRAGLNEAVTDTSFLVVDAELPFNVPISYVAVVEGTTEYTAGPDTYTLDDEIYDVITDAISGEAAQAIRVAQPEWEYQNNASVFQSGGRNIVVSNGFGQYSSEIELYTATRTSADNLKSLLQRATGGIVQIRNSISESDYVATLSYREVRYSNDRTDDRRYFVLTTVQTDGWASALEARGFTLQDIADFYGVSGTLQDIADDFSTLLDIAQADFSM